MPKAKKHLTVPVHDDLVVVGMTLPVTLVAEIDKVARRTLQSRSAVMRTFVLNGMTAVVEA